MTAKLKAKSEKLAAIFKNSLILAIFLYKKNKYMKKALL